MPRWATLYLAKGMPKLIRFSSIIYRPFKLNNYEDLALSATLITFLAYPATAAAKVATLTPELERIIRNVGSGSSNQLLLKTVRIEAKHLDLLYLKHIEVEQRPVRL